MLGAARQQLSWNETKNAKLEAKFGASEADRIQLVDKVDVLTASSEQQNAALSELEAEAKDNAATADGLRQELDVSTSAAAASEAELADQAAELADRAAELAASRAEVTDLTHKTEGLEARVAEVQEASEKPTETSVPSVLMANSEAGDRLDVPGFSPATAWALELVRSERTWRYSVAANPMEDPSPFESTNNALLLAVEIEALALREDVGAFIEVDWQIGNRLDPELDPARAHLTLRVAQEMLAAAAREMEPSRLVVTEQEGEGVAMQITAIEGEDVEFNIPPPPVASEWINIDHSGGMVVTIKTD